MEIKNVISHRGRAMQMLKEALERQGVGAQQRGARD